MRRLLLIGSLAFLTATMSSGDGRIGYRDMSEGYHAIQDDEYPRILSSSRCNGIYDTMTVLFPYGPIMMRLETLYTERSALAAAKEFGIDPSLIHFQKCGQQI